MPHLTPEQRYTISTMLHQGFSQSKIACTIGKDKSVISREIKRNSDLRNGEYKFTLAQKKYTVRQKNKRKAIKFTVQLKVKVESLLKQKYSPEQVVGILKKENQETVSEERIYQHIWSDKKANGTLFTYLRCQGRKYRSRGSSKDSRGIIKNRVSIDRRPNIVDKRCRFGDFEVDLIIGKNHNQAILTLNDRVSGMLKMTKIKSECIANYTHIS